MTSDEAEIRQRVERFLAAWRAGDAKGAVANFAEDGVRVGAFGDIARGRNAVEAAYAALFSGPMGGATMQFTPSVRLIAQEVAIVDGPMDLTTQDGSTLHGWAHDIWVKRAGAWVCVEANPKFYPPRG